MKMNGIHEGSLSNMSRCMLGTPQSLGCLRMTDYGSKFIDGGYQKTVIYSFIMTKIYILINL